MNYLHDWENFEKLAEALEEAGIIGGEPSKILAAKALRQLMEALNLERAKQDDWPIGS